MIGARAWRNLTRHRLRTGLALLGLAVTSAMLLDMILLSGGLERSFERLLLGRGFQVRVSPAGTLPFDTEATIPGIHDLLRAWRSDPAIEAAAPLVGGSLYLRRGDSLETLFGYGVDPAGQNLYQLEAGQDLAAGDTVGLLLSEPAARVSGAGLGDTLVLVGSLDPQVASARRERRLVVRGMVRWLYDYAGQPSVGAELGVVQELLGFDAGDRASGAALRIAEGYDVPETVARLREQFPGLAINSVGDMVERFRERMVYFHQLSLILGSISLVVTLLLVGTLLTITVNERLGEIATLRAIGIGRGRIIREIMMEGLTLVLAGGVLGTLLGMATARYLDRILTSFPGLPASISFFVPEPRGLALAALVLLASGLLAGVYPAWLAGRAPIAATLRQEAT